jgi:hypothetical protein
MTRRDAKAESLPRTDVPIDGDVKVADRGFLHFAPDREIDLVSAQRIQTRAVRRTENHGNGRTESRGLAESRFFKISHNALKHRTETMR